MQAATCWLIVLRPLQAGWYFLGALEQIAFFDTYVVLDVT